MSQVKIDFIVTGNMSSLHKQVQTLNAELMQVAGSMTAVDRSMSNMNLQSANAQFGRMLTQSGQFTQQMVTMRTSTEMFSDSLARQQLSFRDSLSATRDYMMRRGGLIRSLAKQQVMMQNSMVMPHGVSPTGRVTASVITPTGLDKDFATQMRVANKSWEVFNATAQQGATQMVNWGKNTQWAGRQLMVGFTVPLMIAGGLAAKTFKELDEELVRLQKVYGSGFSFGDDFVKQSEMIRDAGIDMAKKMAAAYGQAGEETAALMADLAATGFEGQDLMRMTEQTTKLATLGEVDRQEAMKATVALQSAFKLSTEEVADKVLFLNAVENQTSASLQDLTGAIPRAGTVIKGLGGTVEDLALYMTAMREGGISAAEGANALKSGLSSIIAPPQAAVDFMKEFGINLPKMVQQNAGDLTGTIMAFQKELKGLDDLARQQVITKLFGKYQFARMSAFFENLGAKGSQTQKVLDLMGTGMEDLSDLAEQELGAQAESISGKWDRAWQTFRVQIATVGKEIMKWGTVILDVFTDVFSFVQRHEWLKNIIGGLAAFAAIVGPVIMLMGLFGNMTGMLLKGVLRLANGFKALTSGKGISRTFEMLTAESFQADSAVEQLTGSMYEQAKAQEVLSQGIKELAAAYNMLGTESMEASAGTAAATAAPAGAALSGEAIRRTEHGLYAGTTRLERAHYIPRNIANDADRQLLESIFGYSPAKGRSYNLQQFGYGITSRQANQDAGNTLPFFAGTMRGMTEQQAKAQVDITNYLETQAAKLKAAGVVDSEILAWKKKTLEAARQAARSTAPRAAEAAFAISARDAALLGGADTMQVNGKTVLADMTEGGNFKNYDNRVLAAQPGGLQQSWYAADTAMIKAMGEFSASLKAETAEMRKTMLARKRYGTMIDTAAKLYGDDAASLANDVPEERLNAAMELMATQAGDTALKFELVQTELGTFLVAMEQATGNVLGVAQQGGVGGAFKQLPNASVASSMKSGPIDMANASKTVRVVNAQMERDARERAMIEKQIHQEAQKRLSAERQLAVQRVNTQKATLNILKQNMTYEQKVAQLRKQGLIDEEKGLVLSRKGLTAEQLQTIQDFEQLAAERAQTAQDQAQLRAGIMPSMAPGATGKTGFMGRLGRVGSTIGRFATPALMTTAMASMFLPESDNGAINVAKSAGTWAMMGSMLGPPGIVGGAIIGGLTETLSVIGKNNEEAAMKAAKEWELQFGKIDISSDLQKELKISLDSFKAPTVDLAGFGPVDDASASYSKSVSEGMKDQIESLKGLTSGEALEFSKNFYTNLVAGGASAADAMKLVRELLVQADKDAISYQIGLEVDPDLTEKDAEKAVQDRLNAIVGTVPEQLNTYIVDSVMPSREEVGEMGSNAGKAYYNGLAEAFETGAIDPEKYFSELYKGAQVVPEAIASGFDPKMLERLMNIDSVTEYLEENFGIVAGSVEEMTAQLNNLSPEQLEKFYDAVVQGNSSLQSYLKIDPDVANGLRDLGMTLYTGNQAQSEYLASVRESNPAIAGLAAKLLELDNVESIEEATLMALSNARREYNQQLRETDQLAAMTAAAIKYVDAYPEPINLAQLERQQAREMEAMQEHESDKLDALQEAEDARLEAMQDAADKRERLMQKEINQVERQYDKEIQQIQNAESRRQEAFENEQERARLREEMRNMEISYQEAIANGDLFEAARIRMDIAALKKQREQESKEEKRQQKADNKIAKLEKEKNQKLRILNKELRQEQRANEKMIEAAQEASQAKIEAAQEASEARIAAEERANRLELKDAKETNKEIEKDQRETNDLIAKMNQAMLDGNMKDWRKYAKELGIKHNERVKMMMDYAEKEFGDLPTDARNAIADAIVSGNWDTIGVLMRAAINGASDKHLADLARKDGTSYGDDHRFFGSGYASGGFVSGPGSGTSDSIHAKLSNGEYVISAGSVKKYGKTFFDNLNGGGEFGGSGARGKPVGYAKGGLVERGMSGGALMGMFDSMRQTFKDMSEKAALSDSFGSRRGISAGGHLIWIPSSENDEPVDQLTAAQLKVAGKLMGSRFYVTQGSYQPQTSYSGTTHMGGGVIDVPAYGGMYGAGVKALQRAGFAAWYRDSSMGDWGPHIHAISLFSKNLSSSAAAQRMHYINQTGDGLGNPYYGPHLAPIAGLRSTLGLRKGGRINYDNTIANLHRGETVLTKSLTDKFEDQIANVGGNEYNFDVTIENLSSEVDLERAFEKFVVKHERRQQTRAGRSRRV